MLRFVVNGGFIPFLFIMLCRATEDVFLSSAICLKCFTINYFFWFNHLYNGKYKPLPNCLNWLKQFIRFTDTGHLANLLICLDEKRWFTTAFSVHFIITVAYWSAKGVGKMPDLDEVKDPIIWKPFEKVMCGLNHSLPLFLLSRIAIVNKYSYELSDMLTAMAWIYAWFCCIYLPWRVVTRDVVYEILDSKKTSRLVTFFFIQYIHILLFASYLVANFLVWSSKITKN